MTSAAAAIVVILSILKFDGGIPRCDSSAVVDLVKDVILKPTRQFAPHDSDTDARVNLIKSQMKISGIRDRGKDSSGNIRSCAALLTMENAALTLPETSIVYTIEPTETAGEIVVTVSEQ